MKGFDALHFEHLPPHAWDMSYEEDVRYKEEDTCMSYEEEDTCLGCLRTRDMSYEEEDTCLAFRAAASARV
jgi:hypothetical protein